MKKLILLAAAALFTLAVPAQAEEEKPRQDAARLAALAEAIKTPGKPIKFPMGDREHMIFYFEKKTRGKTAITVLEAIVGMSRHNWRFTSQKVDGENVTGTFDIPFRKSKIPRTLKRHELVPYDEDFQAKP